MDRRTFLAGIPAAALAVSAAEAHAQELQPIELPKPQRSGGRSVLAALWERKTSRDIRPEKLHPQMLSNLLWAAWGINRANGPHGRPGRTAASAVNAQEIDLYVLMAEGAYLYDAAAHRLTPVAEGDKRPLAGGGAAADKAPVKLVFAADLRRYATAGVKADAEVQKSFYHVATGLIAGNVYLFAASQGLAAWFHTCDQAALAAELRLGPDQRVLFAQTVGYLARR